MRQTQQPYPSLVEPSLTDIRPGYGEPTTEPLYCNVSIPSPHTITDVVARHSAQYTSCDDIGISAICYFKGRCLPEHFAEIGAYPNAPTLSMIISISSVISSWRRMLRLRRSSAEVFSNRRTAESICCIRRWFSAMSEL